MFTLLRTFFPSLNKDTHAFASSAACAPVVLTLRFASGSPPRCGASSFPQRALRPAGGPNSPGSRCFGFPGGGAPTRRGLGAQPQAYFGSFCTHKRNATAASRADYAFAKGSAPPPGDHKLAPNSHNKSQLHFPNKTHHLSNSHPVFSHFVNLP